MLTARLTLCSPAMWPIRVMRLRRRWDAQAVTGRVGQWHLTPMEIPSAGAEPISSVQVNEARRARDSLAFYLHCGQSEEKSPGLEEPGRSIETTTRSPV